ncbi:hypothetical protein CJ255_09085 [Candidatus Viridilinea mediisalina]|uniref:Aminotransferase class V domain-containing protein n=1 Tax=Candidatus Viridilinea mediisalina TaxID=2024553 RepID=A0A2A6RKF4_9CHLR|nr:aminotransferase class V-fold PLP-dependent enzyme [Candidatus Viridilinea mediisalina]PDW03401.1 hypothetical protein CJ255_09085 [Candidatus Viridilinea mediisalina]
MTEPPIYMDHHATTPVEPRVLAAMLPYFTEVFGNAASSDHEFGYQASQAVEHARSQLAALINARPDEIIFTSGATEANNLALFELAIATGSACTSATVAPSHVIMALGLGEARAHSSLRFGLGRANTSRQIATAVAIVARRVAELRALWGG